MSQQANLPEQADVIGVEHARASFEDFVDASSGWLFTMALLLTDLIEHRRTLRDGSVGLTVAGCPASPVGTGIPESYAAGLTLYWVGYITDLPHCLPLEVRRLPGSKPVRVTLSTSGGTCPAG